MFLTVFLAMSAFYTAHWQTYVTGSLKFGTVDVTEAQVAIVMVHMATGLFGDSIWALTVKFYILNFQNLQQLQINMPKNKLKIPVIGFELRFLPFLCGLLGSVISICENIKIISGGGKGKHGSTIAVSFFFYRNFF